MLNDYFVKQSIREVELEDYIKVNFPSGDYSDILIQRIPLGLKIIIYTNKPGRIIGKGGKNIEKIGDSLKEKFGLENPQIDIKSVRHPDLDPKLVAKQIASALERGYNYKKIGNVFLKRILDAGAIGCEIIIKGSLGGNMARMGKFISGYFKHCGQPAKELVHTAMFQAQTKRGIIGITIKILEEFQDITGVRKTKDQMQEEKEALKALQQRLFIESEATKESMEEEQRTENVEVPPATEKINPVEDKKQRKPRTPKKKEDKEAAPKENTEKKE